MNKIANNKRVNMSLLTAICASIFCHIALAGAIFYNRFSDKSAYTNEGDLGIKAVMIDLSIIAAPEMSISEDSTDDLRDSDEINNIVLNNDLTQDDTIEQIDTDPVQQEAIDITDVALATDDVVSNTTDITIPQEKDVAIQVKPTTKPASPKPVQTQILNSSSTSESTKSPVNQDVTAPDYAKQVTSSHSSENTQYSALPTPITRRQPEYPRRALDLRIEGQVVVLYDINNQGNVINIRIVDAKPNNIFNQSVRNAMRLWRYQPIAAKDLTVTIIFNRDKSINIGSS